MEYFKDIVLRVQLTFLPEFSNVSQNINFLDTFFFNVGAI